ncbi:MAG: cupin domain-containing protein [Acidobacteria bacterium]|nr:cupin domain-containing protein [Acidobacteriota bacterium]
MKIYQWDTMPAEKLNDLISRKIISGKNVMLATIYLKKGALVPEHRHESEQMSYVISGALGFKVNSEELTVRAGQTIVIPANAPHEVYAQEDTVDIEVFSPIRTDWLDGSDQYLRTMKKHTPK